MRWAALLGAWCACTVVSVPSAAEQTPPASTGFQLALRTGYSLPLGDASKNVKMADLASGQVPIFVELGAKPIPHLFLGGYLGFGFGGPGGRLSDACDGHCTAASFRPGLEAQVHFLPGAFADPWLGYGIGLESLAIASDTGENAALSGVELARLGAGLDLRLTRLIGLGPFVDLAMGRYGSISSGNAESDIVKTAMHEWLTFGARLVFFP